MKEAVKDVVMMIMIATSIIFGAWGIEETL